MEDIQKVFNSKISEWEEKDRNGRIANAIANFNEWIFDCDENEKEVLSRLIKKFDYYSLENVVSILEELTDVLKNEHGITNNDTVISTIKKDNGEINSSNEYMMLHRLQGGFSRKIYIESLDYINKAEWNEIKNIIFIDDCSGTGNQFIKFLKQQKQDFKNKRIFFLVIEIMTDALNEIKRYGDKNGIDIIVIPKTIKEKAFKEEKNEKDLFSSMSRKKEINNNYIFGYKDAQSLMAFYNNTPNDTLGIFWVRTSKNSPIFPRVESEIPSWRSMKNKKKGRRTQQYESKKG